MSNKFSHVDDSGKASMVDVGDKSITLRTAEAMSVVHLTKLVFDEVKNNQIAKGDVLTVAKIAGIQAAKKTSELIPLCHNIFISKIDVSITLDENNNSIIIKSFAKTKSQTGIEMEALTSAAVAGLTVYDMCKALDKSITITDVKLISKSGGKSGDYHI